MPKEIDPKLTETFLLMLPEVIDASVWWSDGAIRAHVTVPENSPLTPKDIQLECANELGLHQTPREIVVFQARRWAA